MHREGMSRRWFLTSVVAAAGTITLTTAGQSVPWLSKLDVLGPRLPGHGRGLSRLPVNRTAGAAGIAAAATSPDYRLRVTGAVRRPLALSLADLRAQAVHTVDLPLTCVEGWSVGARWTGLRLVDLLRQAEAAPGTRVRVDSLERGGLYRSSHLNASHAWSPDTVLATGAEGQSLDLDHGFPLRLIAPSRPGVLQTKWVSEVVVL
ncbi:MAG: hypothetical protein NVS3B26_18330 [Mycobacteriales bacterium]